MHPNPHRHAAATPVLGALLLLLTASMLAAGCGSSGSSGSSKHTKKSSHSAASWPAGPTAIAERAGCTVTTPPRAKAVHIGEAPVLRVQAKDWTSNPPTSGEHYGITSKWGYFDQQVPDAYVVHDLEHGGVAIWYGDKPAAVETTFGKVATSVIKVAIMPRAGLADGDVDLAAWGLLAKCPAAAMHKLGRAKEQAFLRRWANAALDGDWAPEKGIPAMQTGTRPSAAGNGTSLLQLPPAPDPVIDTTVQQS
jgi:hypothetical protein